MKALENRIKGPQRPDVGPNLAKKEKSIMIQAQRLQCSGRG